MHMALGSKVYIQVRKALPYIQVRKAYLRTRIHTDLLESSLGTFWIDKDANYMHANNTDSD